MAGSQAGQLVWIENGSGVVLRVVLSRKTRGRVPRWPGVITVSNAQIPVIDTVPVKGVVFRHPIRVQREDGEWTAGPVFAILTASENGSLAGDRASFRAVAETARRRGGFVYVLPADEVKFERLWTGYVRTGRGRWIPLPCPQPEAVYNRIPNRTLECAPDSVMAKARITSLGIPLFNPDYFNKATIYNVIRQAGLAHHLPETMAEMSPRTLAGMLARHPSIYLKPTGGSIGHGMMKVERGPAGYRLSVLKHSRCRDHTTDTFAELWMLVAKHRLPGKYVVQAAVPIIQWHGRPCDFRVLLRKQADQWSVVGKGVRVAGKHTITTHVPNGGAIADAAVVLGECFGTLASQVDEDIDRLALECAEAIDRYYDNGLGEMSMDIGVDVDGKPWFLEANSKPMKFDEPEIRRRSLAAIVDRLEELRTLRRADTMERK